MGQYLFGIPHVESKRKLTGKVFLVDIRHGGISNPEPSGFVGEEFLVIFVAVCVRIGFSRRAIGSLLMGNVKFWLLDARGRWWARCDASARKKIRSLNFIGAKGCPILTSSIWVQIEACSGS